MKLNKPLLVTWATDYLLVAVLFILNHHGPDERLTWLGSILAVLSFIVATNLRDELWVRLGADTYVSKHKKEKSVTVEDVLFVFQQLALFLPMTATLTLVGIFHYRSEGPWTILRVLYEFYSMILFKDQVSMRFGHTWMHTPAGWQHHKGHHYGKKNLRLILAYHGNQWVDLNIETLSGPLLLMLFNTLLFGNPSIHLASWLLIVWADHEAHSANPYSIAYLNPILDWLFLHNVGHHLHHVFVDTNMFFVPYHHLNGSRRKQDLEKYNKTMGTEVDFSLFVE
uniref:Fatty acid hydroxylase domain-containing protein n=1 Tax=Chromera velia CCMP2878 TaxID=1169474 RepID=A0A0G4GD20_9ALVE|eukprot:Cvel_21334.t1-p1 / transcript=Cvel_21334.t1 / gene=Cvel_21334 / organism=Chromera_velia_CCMP2878 / gene_product=hypothetical protein / transcript_product=hypothetical protein / location=Cvel_scaffold1990:3637-4479(+) / protein_length=281 / sequence_SO=supercontig / SO=protein_coding / is_pseudo=false